MPRPKYDVNREYNYKIEPFPDTLYPGDRERRMQHSEPQKPDPEPYVHPDPEVAARDREWAASRQKAALELLRLMRL